MKRREFMQCVSILLGAASMGSASLALSEEQRIFLAAAPNFNSRTVDYLTPERRRIVSAMAEVIIPRTDTPGAIDAGVPQFLEIMIAEWLNEEERDIFETGLADIESRIPSEFGAAFPDLSPEQQLKIMEKLEEASSGSPWWDGGGLRSDFMSDAPFICQFKELTIYGFFTSEIGGTQVLRHNPMPMRFDGHFPLEPGDSSWSGGLI